jgi:cytosine/adenosine deaminase-related metal-dependent hydrolase
VVAQVVSADWVVPVEGDPIRDGAVAIGDDGRIAAVGRAAELGAGERHEGCVIVPGFVNAHSHIEYACYAGFGDGLPFGPWIATHIRRKQRLDAEDMVAIARLGTAECLRSGITTIGDASFSGAAAVAAAELGLRAIVHLEVFGGPEALEPSFGLARERIEPWLSDRVRLGISPHAPYTCTPEMYAACLALGLPIATHFAESLGEQEWLTAGAGFGPDFPPGWLPTPLGQTGIRALAARNLLGPTMLAAHCVHVEEDEIALLARHDVAVAHCPRSNAYLGCGVAPLEELRAAGVRVGLGTDSPASTPSLDMFAEMRTAIEAARARARRPDALGAADALELATLGGARALGLDAEIGTLGVGKKADLAIISLAETSFVPWEDPITAVVLGGSPQHVVETFVEGLRTSEKGIEWHALIEGARRARSRMLA